LKTIKNKGLKVNWASYNAYCYNYCCQLKVVKEEGRNQRRAVYFG
jgi:hypothetical protein